MTPRKFGRVEWEYAVARPGNQQSEMVFLYNMGKAEWELCCFREGFWYFKRPKNPGKGKKK